MKPFRLLVFAAVSIGLSLWFMTGGRQKMFDYAKSTVAAVKGGVGNRSLADQLPSASVVRAVYPASPEVESTDNLVLSKISSRRAGAYNYETDSSGYYKDWH